MLLNRPNSLQDERAVLKCLILNYELYFDMKQQLTPDMFFGEDNALVYKVFLELVLDGQSPDTVLVMSKLQEKGHLDLIGGEEYFKSLLGLETLESNFSNYVDNVFSTYLSRQIIDAGKEIVDVGYKENANTALQVLCNKTDTLLTISTNRGSAVTAADIMSTELEALIDRIKTGTGGSGYKTLFLDYDDLTGGLHPSDEVIIAARPSVGKTTMATRWMLNLAKQGIPCLFFSYEMSRTQLAQRMMAMESGVNLAKIRSGRLPAGDEYNRVVAASKEVGSLPVYISTAASAGVLDVIKESKKMSRKHGVKAVFIDYIQLMPMRIEYATQDLGEIARSLKMMAIDTNLLVVYLSQLNRGVESRANKVPLLSDLRQSGNLEEHADVVLMLHREELYNPTPDNRGIIEIWIRKNRNGPIGVLPAVFHAASVDISPVGGT